MSQVENETVLGLSKTTLTDKSGQGIEGKLLNIFKTETEKIFVDTKI